MGNANVSVHDFKRLEEKVNRLLIIHQLDSVLTDEEKRLVNEAKDDIKNKRKEKFANIGEL